MMARYQRDGMVNIAHLRALLFRDYPGLRMTLFVREHCGLGRLGKMEVANAPLFF
jgi:hypothetical protein